MTGETRVRMQVIQARRAAPRIIWHQYKIGYIIEGSNSNSFSNRTPVNYLKIGVPACIISREPHSLCTRILRARNGSVGSRPYERAARDHFRLVLHRFVLTIPRITQPSSTALCFCFMCAYVNSPRVRASRHYWKLKFECRDVPPAIIQR